MNVNQAALKTLFQVFAVKFNEATKAAKERAFPNQMMVEDVAMEVASSGAATNHAWMNQLPGMREWVGDRVVKNLQLGVLTVTNRDFESTVSVKRNDLEDDNYGVYTPLVSSMGATAEGLWLQLATEALKANGVWADDNAFFCSGRTFGASIVTNAVKAALSRTAVEAALATMRGWTLDGNQSAGVRPTVLVVGPALEATAKQICEAALVKDGDTSVSNTSPAMSLTVRVCADLVGAHEKTWFVLGDKNGIRSVCVQKRKLPTLTRMDKDDDPNVFNKNEYLYGTDARGESFLTLPFLAYRGNPDTDVTAWEAKD